MKKNYINWLATGALLLGTLAGCGGGGGSSAPTPVSTMIQGTASAGIIYPGTVKVYALNTDGTKGALLGTAATEINGRYNASLGPYSGAISVEASGSYTDEATGRTMSIPATKPLHALLDAVNTTTHNNRTVSVTPLTEIAWRKASNNGTTAVTLPAMLSATRLTNDIFKISDITAVEPVRPDNASMANASQESQAYTLALTALSVLASTASGATDDDKLESMLTGMSTELGNAESSGKMSPTVVSDFTAALGADPLSTDFPKAAAQLARMGKKSQLLTLATSGTLPVGTKIFAIEGTIALPLDAANQLLATLRADSNGETMEDVLLLAGLATGKGGAVPVANYLEQQQVVNFSVLLDARGTGIDPGDFATIAYDVIGASAVTAADFSVIADTVSVKDANGATISGITVILK